MLTETQKNFVDSEGSVELGKPDSQQVHEEKPGGDQDLSCVFRKGDYNVTDEKATERFESINRKDFTSKDSAVSKVPTSTTHTTLFSIVY